MIWWICGIRENLRPLNHRTGRDMFDTDPTLVPGSGRYEKFDTGWVRALTAVQEAVKRPFPIDGSVVDVPDTLTIAMAGDWGTNCAPANTSIRDLMIAENPDLTIHLGDVYYAGQPDEEAAFIDMWPAGKLGSFTLDSNHAMYSGGAGYLQELADPKFAIQGGKSYFALRNKNWLIIGLDTAYSAPDFLYKEGRLDNRQLIWLNGILASAGERGVILLTHHDGFNLRALDAEPQEPRPRGIIYKHLWSQIALPRRFRWYWGHVHAPAVYDNGCRCIGHGGVPYLPFPDFYQDFGDHKVKVLWTETEAARDGNPLRAPNGFAMVWLDGPMIREQIVDEYSRARWQSL
jgi:hypothetical protein